MSVRTDKKIELLNDVIVGYIVINNGEICKYNRTIAHLKNVRTGNLELILGLRIRNRVLRSTSASRREEKEKKLLCSLWV